ncbi:MAG: hypothetical protein K2H05_02940 [Duncaniella sp.]|nr:hypothetical protein [Duncaniella sp.]
MNDSEFATDKDRVRARQFMESRFPNPSQFEK